MDNKGKGAPGKTKSHQEPPSFWNQYRDHVRTAAALLLGDGTLVLLALFIMAIVLLALKGFLVLGASPNIVDFVEAADTYSMLSIILIFCVDTPIKILTIVVRGHKT